jgi:hypothetical protein
MFHQMYESPSLGGSFLRYLTSRLVEWAVIHLPHSSSPSQRIKWRERLIRCY